MKKLIQLTVALAVVSAINVSRAQTTIGGGTVASGGTDRVDNFIAMSVPVPEPSTLALAAMGMAGCLLVFRRRRN
jgi:hypothetical protein